MTPYLLFFDIDGTLLDNRTDNVPDSAMRAIEQARKNGHKVFLCTGRCRVFIPEQVRHLDFDGMVAGCGTAVYYNGEKIFHKTMSQELQREIAEDMIRCKVDGVLEGDNYCYFQDEPFMPMVKEFFHSNGEKYGPDCRRRWQQEEKLAFDKFTLWFNEDSDMDGFKAKYEDRFEFIRRDVDFYEIVPRGCSKATGIELLCQTIGVERSHTMGFGDSTNDLSMLEYTGISVAMGDGNPVLFDQVDYVTAAVAEDGIEQAMKKYNIID